LNFKKFNLSNSVKGYIERVLPLEEHPKKGVERRCAAGKQILRLEDFRYRSDEKQI